MDVNVKCEGCGANVTYKPGTEGLTCEYCQHFMPFEVKAAETAHEELDLEAYLESATADTETVSMRVVDCTACGASTELGEHQQSSACPFCDTPLVVAQAHTEKLIKARGLLPFHIEKSAASQACKQWLSKLWFAPNALKKQTTQLNKLRGLYLPFWTYDCATVSHYVGQRGDHYWETHTVTNADGKTEQRRERKTRWRYVSGSIDHAFDDVLVPATQSLPQQQLDKLEPWDLHNLVDYQDEYLNGYTTETYQIDLKQGYQKAKKKMDEALRQFIERDIGGDEQRIHSVDTRFYEATFKHILLPVWVTAYRFKQKLYQVIINARTGEVIAERPWSIAKLASLAFAIACIIGLAVWGVSLQQQT